MTLQHVMAFTVTDDHAAQERVWKELPDWRKNDPDAIRDMLTETEITAADRRVQFVTLKAYEKAGGVTRRDLFSEGEDGVFIGDIPLLESLVAKKLEKAAVRLRKEGWKWVEVRSSFDHEEWSACERRHPEPSPLPPEEEAEMQQLTEEREALWEVRGTQRGTGNALRDDYGAHRGARRSPGPVASGDARHCRGRGHARS